VTRVLLTGGAGFVGRQILARLLERNCGVRLPVRKPVTLAPQVEQIVIEDLFTASSTQLQQLCSDIDVVIHSAWYAVPGKYLTADENIACLTGTLQLAQTAIHAGVARFVGIGTCFEYDLASGYLCIDTPIAPTTLYGACKASAFLSLSQLMSREERSFAWCRLFYLYGEGESERRLVPYIRTRLAAGEPAQLTSGRQIRDYMDVREAGIRIADVALSDAQGPINICSGKPITVADLARRVADEYARQDLLLFGAQADRHDDPPCVVGEPGMIALCDAEWRKR
jgi:nucleoside-diphosphate-sugar epimerase